MTYLMIFHRTFLFFASFSIFQHLSPEAYQNLTSQRAPHDTLLRLGAYLMGEFGHLLPPSVTPRAKFEALHRHFVRGSQQTKAALAAGWAAVELLVLDMLDMNFGCKVGLMG